jgi:hypothetical protein
MDRINDLESTIKFLWQIIDDIDTASDMAKSDDKLYRNIVENRQKRRWETGITCDGYNLDLSKIKNMTENDVDKLFNR